MENSGLLVIQVFRWLPEVSLRCFKVPVIRCQAVIFDGWGVLSDYGF